MEILKIPFVTSGSNAVASLYPIRVNEGGGVAEEDDEYVLLGAPDKYTAIAQKNRTAVAVSSLGL